MGYFTIQLSSPIAYICSHFDAYPRIQLSSIACRLPVAMVRYAIKHQKAVIYLMVVEGLPAKAIAEEVGIGIHQARRYRAKYKLTGSPFVEPKTPQNSLVLAPWSMEKVFDLLKDKPDLYLDEIQWFLTLECNLYVDISTISRRLNSAQWSKK
ncbi:hypothetical protein B0H67DRAFT_196755 [Lasiosphaeris hirsuta]|uniref:Uncharacterized protein n=1 Tax=Lasiosphaeris hirsuta TaxID=260670 RepID=A0AA40ARE3_9PEZI|nr:hypothetical protein B0H67DRAFT_196755 [Lasiosphaeris hirsuta]